MPCSPVNFPVYKRATRQNKLGTFNEICFSPVAPCKAVQGSEALSDCISPIYLALKGAWCYNMEHYNIIFHGLKT